MNAMHQSPAGIVSGKGQNCRGREVDRDAIVPLFKHILRSWRRCVNNVALTPSLSP